jgi:lipoprotein signal peptidase
MFSRFPNIFLIPIGIIFCFILRFLIPSTLVVLNYNPLGFLFGVWSFGIILGLLIFCFLRSKNFGVSLVLAGFLSNSLEFLVFGNVVDYINFSSVLIPNFYLNLADVLIVVGWGIVVWRYFRSKKVLRW